MNELSQVVPSMPVRVNSRLTLRLLRAEELEQASRLVGRGMCDNPSNVTVFRIKNRKDRAIALGRFFLPVLGGLYRRGFVLGAFDSSGLVGVCGMGRPGFCQPRTVEKLRVLPAAVIGNPLSTPIRILGWVGEWASRDPDEPHWHLGPVAVEPALQMQGIGSAMLRAFCSVIDCLHAPAYLETDKPQNVHFYERYGFRTIDSAEMLGVRNWFMSRAPQPGATMVPDVGKD